MRENKQTLPDALCTRLSYRNQTAIDFSEPLIKSMQGRYPRITWRVMDIRELDFATGSFDVCIDKATLDAMLYGSLWDPEDEVKTNVGRYVDEVGWGFFFILFFSRFPVQC